MRSRSCIGLAVALLAGCGGAGSSSEVLPASRTSGNWSGTWAQVSPGAHHGNLAITISTSDFNLLGAAGTVDDDRGDGAVTGFLMMNSGQSSLDFPYTGPEGLGHETYSGKLSLDRRGHLVGTLEMPSAAGATTFAQIDLAR